MSRYRIYLLTKDNHIASAPITIACENDQVAVQQSLKFLDGNDIQLWQGRRLVTRLTANSLSDRLLNAAAKF